MFPGYDALSIAKYAPEIYELRPWPQAWSYMMVGRNTVTLFFCQWFSVCQFWSTALTFSGPKTYLLSFDLRCCTWHEMYHSADILAGRKTVGQITGSVLFAGHKPGQQFLRRYSSYVEQFGRLPLTSHHLKILIYTPAPLSELTASRSPIWLAIVVVILWRLSKSASIGVSLNEGADWVGTCALSGPWKFRSKISNRSYWNVCWSKGLYGSTKSSWIHG